MLHYKTILITLVSAGPLIKGDTDKTPDRRLISYDQILNDGEVYARSSVFFTGDAARHADLLFGRRMELTYFSKNDGGKIMTEYKYI